MQDCSISNMSKYHIDGLVQDYGISEYHIDGFVEDCSITRYIEGLVQDCNISIVKAIGISESCTEPSIWPISSHNNLLFGSWGVLSWGWREISGTMELGNQTFAKYLLQGWIRWSHNHLTFIIGTHHRVKYWEPIVEYLDWWLTQQLQVSQLISTIY